MIANFLLPILLLTISFLDKFLPELLLGDFKYGHDISQCPLSPFIALHFLSERLQEILGIVGISFEKFTPSVEYVSCNCFEALVMLGEDSMQFDGCHLGPIGVFHKIENSLVAVAAAGVELSIANVTKDTKSNEGSRFQNISFGYCIHRFAIAKILLARKATLQTSLVVDRCQELVVCSPRSRLSSSDRAPRTSTQQHCSRDKRSRKEIQDRS